MSGRIVEIEGVFGELKDPKDIETVRSRLKTISELAHKLAGSAGTYGFDLLEIHAGTLEQHCDELLQTGEHLTADNLALLENKIQDMHTAAQNSNTAQTT